MNAKTYCHYRQKQLLSFFLLQIDGILQITIFLSSVSASILFVGTIVPPVARAVPENIIWTNPPPVRRLIIVPRNQGGAPTFINFPYHGPPLIPTRTTIETTASPPPTVTTTRTSSSTAKTRISTVSRNGLETKPFNPKRSRHEETMVATKRRITTTVKPSRPKTTYPKTRTVGPPGGRNQKTDSSPQTMKSSTLKLPSSLPNIIIKQQSLPGKIPIFYPSLPNDTEGPPVGIRKNETVPPPKSSPHLTNPAAKNLRKPNLLQVSNKLRSLIITDANKRVPVTIVVPKPTRNQATTTSNAKRPNAKNTPSLTRVLESSSVQNKKTKKTANNNTHGYFNHSNLIEPTIVTPKTALNTSSSPLTNPSWHYRPFQYLTTKKAETDEHIVFRDSVRRKQDNNFYAAADDGEGSRNENGGVKEWIDSDKANKDDVKKQSVFSSSSRRNRYPGAQKETMQVNSGDSHHPAMSDFRIREVIDYKAKLDNLTLCLQAVSQSSSVELRLWIPAVASLLLFISNLVFVYLYLRQKNMRNVCIACHLTYASVQT